MGEVKRATERRKVYMNKGPMKPLGQLAGWPPGIPAPPINLSGYVQISRTNGVRYWTGRKG